MTQACAVRDVRVKKGEITIGIGRGLIEPVCNERVSFSKTRDIYAGTVSGFAFPTWEQLHFSADPVT